MYTVYMYWHLKHLLGKVLLDGNEAKEEVLLVLDDMQFTLQSWIEDSAVWKLTLAYTLTLAAFLEAARNLFQLKLWTLISPCDCSLYVYCNVFLVSVSSHAF